MEPLDESLARLGDPDPRRRDVAAAEIGDLLRGGGLGFAAATAAVARLVESALGEQDFLARESALHAITEAFGRYEFPLEVVAPLATGRAGIEPVLLGYVLYILSATHDPRACPLVRPFLDHPDPGVREEAALALTEIPCPAPARSA
ncbi:HEAT repeat domain-containing protein [Actinomadura macrotermitis]|uniref:HEAT repeat domain-containing protein n=1 Tax=Actinomadura macrotermitis TaxID=2585200 RepID=A0A7K0BW36_9ACTN|nr:HEAT repeat domain-containing protein [Actinomadura macrotermitis]MQY05286.1 hypothetical protein [Actinomadura macrotermitis]